MSAGRGRQSDFFRLSAEGWQVVEQQPKKETADEDHSRYGVVSDDDVSCETKEEEGGCSPTAAPLAAKKTI